MWMGEYKVVRRTAERAADSCWRWRRLNVRGSRFLHNIKGSLGVTDIFGGMGESLKVGMT